MIYLSVLLGFDGNQVSIDRDNNTLNILSILLYIKKSVAFSP